MDMKLPIIALVSLVVAVGVGAAGMNGPGNNMQGNAQMPQFSDFDTNQDGVITPDELEAFRTQRIAERSAEGRVLRNIGNAPTFETLDLNQDQMIDEQEFNSNCNGNMMKGNGRGKSNGRGNGQGFRQNNSL